MAIPRKRLDDLLVKQELASTLQAARALILAGSVFVNQQRVDKPGTQVNPSSEISLRRKPSKYVSRGGLKLEAAIDTFEVGVRGHTCLDLGASTGGFTDCLLQHGARRVYAVDVGRGQLDWKLRNDPRVIVREAVNARYLTPANLPEEINIITVDVSFISLRLIFPVIRRFLGSKILALVKPQFEAERHEVEPGGLIRKPEKREEILGRVKRLVLEQQAGDHGYDTLTHSGSEREPGILRLSAKQSRSGRGIKQLNQHFQVVGQSKHVLVELAPKGKEPRLGRVGNDLWSQSGYAVTLCHLQGNGTFKIADTCPFQTMKIFPGLLADHGSLDGESQVRYFPAMVSEPLDQSGVGRIAPTIPKPPGFGQDHVAHLQLGIELTCRSSKHKESGAVPTEVALQGPPCAFGTQASHQVLADRPQMLFQGCALLLQSTCNQAISHRFHGT